MKRGIIFLAGDFESLPEDFIFLSNDCVIAADGGYHHLKKLGLEPHLLLGDFDSLSEQDQMEADAKGIPMQVWPREKDQTDGEIALREAVLRGCDHLIFFGCWGGDRVEHSIANLMLLDLCEELGVTAVLHHRGENIVALSPGSYPISGSFDDMVSLIPKSNVVSGVSTRGLKFSLSNESLKVGSTRGISNQFLQSEAEVAFDSGKLWLVWRGELPQSQDYRKNQLD